VRAVSLVAASLRTATFDAEEMARRAAEGFITVTELADTLTREQGLPFAQSHAIAAGLVEAHRKAPDRPLREQLRDVSTRVTGAAIDLDPARLDDVLCPSHFVRVRETLGGPAPSRTAEAVRAADAMLARDTAWIAAARARLAGADRDRSAALQAL